MVLMNNSSKGTIHYNLLFLLLYILLFHLQLQPLLCFPFSSPDLWTLPLSVPLLQNHLLCCFPSILSSSCYSLKSFQILLSHSSPLWGPRRAVPAHSWPRCLPQDFIQLPSQWGLMTASICISPHNSISAAARDLSYSWTGTPLWRIFWRLYLHCPFRKTMIPCQQAFLLKNLQVQDLTPTSHLSSISHLTVGSLPLTPTVL